jgi:hypothetical protein
MRSLHSLRAEDALRDLCAVPASAFGERLLARASGPVISFREFVAVARELVRAEPDAMATWLAALVALDVRGGGLRPDEPPSPN